MKNRSIKRSSKSTYENKPIFTRGPVQRPAYHQPTRSSSPLKYQVPSLSNPHPLRSPPTTYSTSSTSSPPLLSSPPLHWQRTGSARMAAGGRWCKSGGGSLVAMGSTVNRMVAMDPVVMCKAGANPAVGSSVTVDPMGSPHPTRIPPPPHPVRMDPTHGSSASDGRRGWWRRWQG